MPITRATQAASSGAPLTYTNGFVDNNTAAVTATQIFSAASNPNGAYVEYVALSGLHSNSGGTNVTLLAKAGAAPASNTDGEAIFKASTGTGNPSATMHHVPANVQQTQRIKIAANKGLYLNQTIINSAAANTCEKTVLYTLL